MAESSPGNPWGAWLWVRGEVLSAQRVGCSVVMGPVGRGHLTYGQCYNVLKIEKPRFTKQKKATAWNLFAISKLSFVSF